MEEYKPNSYKYKNSQREEKKETDEKKVTSIVSGKTKTKKNDVRKFTNAFISEDVGDVKSYVFGDVLIPSLKKLIYDTIKYTMKMLLFSEVKGRKSGSASSPFVSYRNCFDERDPADRFSVASPKGRNVFDYDDIIFTSKGDAEATLMEMDNIIDAYGFVTVMDLYDLAGQTAPYTSNKYGWTSLRNAETIRVRDGYVIKLPRALPID